MANYCDNTIQIYDFEDEKKIKTLNKKIETAIKNKNNLLNIVVTPKQLNKIWEKGILNIANKLGTKWLFANDIYKNKDLIELYADSAWSPPTGWAVKLSKRYKCSVKIKFDEPGIGFMGTFTAKNGEIIKNKIIEY